MTTTAYSDGTIESVTVEGANGATTTDTFDENKNLVQVTNFNVTAEAVVAIGVNSPQIEASFGANLGPDIVQIGSGLEDAAIGLGLLAGLEDFGLATLPIGVPTTEVEGIVAGIGAGFVAAGQALEK